MAAPLPVARVPSQLGPDLTWPRSSPKNTAMRSTGSVAAPRSLRLTSQILLAIQVLSLGHLLSARHLTCPLHGDIIHVAHLAETPLAPSDEGPAGCLQRSIAAGESSVDADHDHCLACIDTNKRGLPAAAGQSLASEVIVVGLADASRAAVVAPVDLVLLAPKNSPPSA